MNSNTPDKAQNGNTHIIINGRQHSIEGNSISYEELVSLAFPTGSVSDGLYSIMYSGPNMADGSLGQGGTINIKNGMKFDVSLTNRS